jgi:hypothetical protein
LLGGELYGLLTGRANENVEEFLRNRHNEV